MSQNNHVSETPPSTYPIDSDPYFLGSNTQPNTEDEISSIWGELVPFSTILTFNIIELENDVYTFGRLSTCDVVFSNGNMSEDHLKVTSKIHFKITRSQVSSVNIASLEDLSSNGTYVNCQKLGKGKKILLKHNDLISLALPHIKVFVYIDVLEDDSALYPDEIRSKYIITRELGAGACGQVRLAFEKSTCRMFAVKIIQKSQYSYKGINDPQKIQNEVKILKSLSHPCIIHIEDFVDSPQRWFIILNLVEGGDLMKFISKKQTIPEDEVKQLFYQIVLAVQYLHSKGITHRDIKPQNILMTDHSVNALIKITDFGLSKARERSLIGSGNLQFSGESRSEMMHTVCGSPLYVAPEILSRCISHDSEASTKGYTRMVDVWSMGVVLYLCLSGTVPFLHPDDYGEDYRGLSGDNSGEDSTKSVNKKHSPQSAILNGSYHFPEKIWRGVSDSAMDLIKKMLTVDPKKRITINSILEHPWLQDQDMISRVHSIMEKYGGASADSSNTSSREEMKRALKRRKTMEDI